MGIYKLGLKKVDTIDFGSRASYIPIQISGEDLFILFTGCNQIYGFSGQDKELFLRADDREKQEMLNKMASSKEIDSPDMIDSESFTVCLNLAHDCNLRCKYCYADGGSYCQNRSLMSPQMAVHALEWAACHTDKTLLNIIFFGGEPLLNMDAIEEVLCSQEIWSHQKKVSYAITTNGTMLSQRLFALFNNQINVTVSMDGPSKDDNQLRVFPDGTNAYETICRSLDSLEKKSKQHIRIRMTVADGYHNIVEKVNQYVNQGINNINVEFIYIDDLDFYNNIDLSYVRTELSELARISIRLWMNRGIVVNPFVKNFKKLIYGIISPSTCTAGEEMLSITPDGSVYPCFKYIQDSWRLGHISEERVQEKYDAFVRMKTEVKQLHCGSCELFSMCGGTCVKEYDKAFFKSGLLCEISHIICHASLSAYVDYWKEDSSFIQRYQHMEKAFGLLKHVL